MAHQYQLTLSEEQAHTVERALDLYSRIGIGQFEEVAQVYCDWNRVDLDARETMRGALLLAKSAGGHPANGSHGIHSRAVHDEFRVAYDVQQVVRHRLAWTKHPNGGITVNFDQPRQTGSLPLATMTAEPTDWERLRGEPIIK